MSVNIYNGENLVSIAGRGSTGPKGDDGGGTNDNFVGTLAQWNALSAAEKMKYKTADITDDFNGSPIDSALSDTSSNPVQNKVVKAAIDEAKIGIHLPRIQYSSSTGEKAVFASILDQLDDYEGGDSFIFDIIVGSWTNFVGICYRPNAIRTFAYLFSSPSMSQKYYALDRLTENGVNTDKYYESPAITIIT